MFRKNSDGRWIKQKRRGRKAGHKNNKVQANVLKISPELWMYLPPKISKSLLEKQLIDSKAVVLLEHMKEQTETNESADGSHVTHNGDLPENQDAVTDSLSGTSTSNQEDTNGCDVTEAKSSLVVDEKVACMSLFATSKTKNDSKRLNSAPQHQPSHTTERAKEAPPRKNSGRDYKKRLLKMAKASGLLSPKNRVQNTKHKGDLISKVISNKKSSVFSENMSCNVFTVKPTCHKQTKLLPKPEIIPLKRPRIVVEPILDTMQSGLSTFSTSDDDRPMPTLEPVKKDVTGVVGENQIYQEAEHMNPPNLQPESFKIRFSQDLFSHGSYKTNFNISFPRDKIKWDLPKHKKTQYKLVPLDIPSKFVTHKKDDLETRKRLTDIDTLSDTGCDVLENPKRENLQTTASDPRIVADKGVYHRTTNVEVAQTVTLDQYISDGSGNIDASDSSPVSNGLSSTKNSTYHPIAKPDFITLDLNTSEIPIPLIISSSPNNFSTLPSPDAMSEGSLTSAYSDSPEKEVALLSDDDDEYPLEYRRQTDNKDNEIHSPDEIHGLTPPPSPCVVIGDNGEVIERKLINGTHKEDDDTIPYSDAGESYEEQNTDVTRDESLSIIYREWDPGDESNQEFCMGGAEDLTPSNHNGLFRSQLVGKTITHDKSESALKESPNLVLPSADLEATTPKQIVMENESAQQHEPPIESKEVLDSNSVSPLECTSNQHERQSKQYASSASGEDELQLHQSDSQLQDETHLQLNFSISEGEHQGNGQLETGITSFVDTDEKDGSSGGATIDMFTAAKDDNGQKLNKLQNANVVLNETFGLTPENTDVIETSKTTSNNENTDVTSIETSKDTSHIENADVTPIEMAKASCDIEDADVTSVDTSETMCDMENADDMSVETNKTTSDLETADVTLVETSETTPVIEAKSVLPVLPIINHDCEEKDKMCLNEELGVPGDHIMAVCLPETPAMSDHIPESSTLTDGCINKQTESPKSTCEDNVVTDCTADLMTREPTDEIESATTEPMEYIDLNSATCKTDLIQTTDLHPKENIPEGVHDTGHDDIRSPKEGIKPVAPDIELSNIFKLTAMLDQLPESANRTEVIDDDHKQQGQEHSNISASTDNTNDACNSESQVLLDVSSADRAISEVSNCEASEKNDKEMSQSYTNGHTSINIAEPAGTTVNTEGSDTAEKSLHTLCNQEVDDIPQDNLIAVANATVVVEDISNEEAVPHRTVPYSDETNINVPDRQPTKRKLVESETGCDDDIQAILCNIVEAVVEEVESPEPDQDSGLVISNVISLADSSSESLKELQLNVTQLLDSSADEKYYSVTEESNFDESLVPDTSEKSAEGQKDEGQAQNTMVAASELDTEIPIQNQKIYTCDNSTKGSKEMETVSGLCTSQSDTSKGSFKSDLLPLRISFTRTGKKKKKVTNAEIKPKEDYQLQAVTTKITKSKRGAKTGSSRTNLKPKKDKHGQSDNQLGRYSRLDGDSRTDQKKRTGKKNNKFSDTSKIPYSKNTKSVKDMNANSRPALLKVFKTRSKSKSQDDDSNNKSGNRKMDIADSTPDGNIRIKIKLPRDRQSCMTAQDSSGICRAYGKKEHSTGKKRNVPSNRRTKRVSKERQCADCDDMPTILPVKRKYRRRYGQVNKRSKVEYSSKFDNKRVENLDELAFTQIKKQDTPNLAAVEKHKLDKKISKDCLQRSSSKNNPRSCGKTIHRSKVGNDDSDIKNVAVSHSSDTNNTDKILPVNVSAPMSRHLEAPVKSETSNKIETPSTIASMPNESCSSEGKTAEKSENCTDGPMYKDDVVLKSILDEKVAANAQKLATSQTIPTSVTINQLKTDQANTAENTTTVTTTTVNSVTEHIFAPPSQHLFRSLPENALQIKNSSQVGLKSNSAENCKDTIMETNIKNLPTETQRIHLPTSISMCHQVSENGTKTFTITPVSTGHCETQISNVSCATVYPSSFPTAATPSVRPLKVTSINPTNPPNAFRRPPSYREVLELKKNFTEVGRGDKESMNNPIAQLSSLSVCEDKTRNNVTMVYYNGIGQPAEGIPDVIRLESDYQKQKKELLEIHKLTKAKEQERQMLLRKEQQLVLQLRELNEARNRARRKYFEQSKCTLSGSSDVISAAGHSHVSVANQGIVITSGQQTIQSDCNRILNVTNNAPVHVSNSEVTQYTVCSTPNSGFNTVYLPHKDHTQQLTSSCGQNRPPDAHSKMYMTPQVTSTVFLNNPNQNAILLNQISNDSSDNCSIIPMHDGVVISDDQPLDLKKRGNAATPHVLVNSNIINNQVSSTNMQPRVTEKYIPDNGIRSPQENIPDGHTPTNTQNMPMDLTVAEMCARIKTKYHMIKQNANPTLTQQVVIQPTQLSSVDANGHCVGGERLCVQTLSQSRPDSSALVQGNSGSANALNQVGALNIPTKPVVVARQPPPSITPGLPHKTLVGNVPQGIMPQGHLPGVITQLPNPGHQAPAAMPTNSSIRTGMKGPPVSVRPDSTIAKSISEMHAKEAEFRVLIEEEQREQNSFKKIQNHTLPSNELIHNGQKPADFPPQEQLVRDTLKNALSKRKANSTTRRKDGVKKQKQDGNPVNPLQTSQIAPVPQPHVLVSTAQVNGPYPTQLPNVTPLPNPVPIIHQPNCNVVPKHPHMNPNIEIRPQNPNGMDINYRFNLPVANVPTSCVQPVHIHPVMPPPRMNPPAGEMAGPPRPHTVVYNNNNMMQQFRPAVPPAGGYALPCPPSMMQACAACGRPAASVCAGCHVVWYCSNPCQEASWDNHRVECRKHQARIKTDIEAPWVGAFRQNWQSKPRLLKGRFGPGILIG